jgi:hypothetical protein
MGCRALNWLGSGQGKVAGPCKHGNEPTGIIKCRTFGLVRNCELLKKLCEPRESATL